MNQQDMVIGLARACQEPTLIPGRSPGLITNFTGVTADLRTSAGALLAAGVPLRALFTPEHGLHGSVQAGKSEPPQQDPVTGLPAFDTYLHSGNELDQLLIGAGIDSIAFDMQDIGVRFYTYIWTMYDCMLSATRLGLPFAVLDRPNPLGGRVSAGPGLDCAFASFVGRASLPIRHGLTVGELARHLAPADLDLRIVPMQGWQPDLLGDQNGVPWVPPSPNIPTFQSALAFCGTGLLEGTNLSEGRGTTRPFEVVGAPYLDESFTAALRESELPGVLFRDLRFIPTFHKYAGQLLHGVGLHITDYQAYDPLATALRIIHLARTLYPQDFSFLPPGIGVDNGTLAHAIDLLWGSDSLRSCVEAGLDPASLLPPSGPPANRVSSTALIYPREELLRHSR